MVPSPLDAVAQDPLTGLCLLVVTFKCDAGVRSDGLLSLSLRPSGWCDVCEDIWTSESLKMVASVGASSGRAGKVLCAELVALNRLLLAAPFTLTAAPVLACR